MQSRQKCGVWERKVVNGKRHACKLIEPAKNHNVRQRLKMHGMHAWKLIEPIRNQNVKQRPKMLGRPVCKTGLTPTVDER